MDLTINLKSLEFENGLGEYEREFTYLRSRSADLTVCGCGHAVFLCQMASLLREKVKGISNKSHLQGLNVGILGGGNIGKQLTMVLLGVPGFRPCNISISTKRPETLSEFSRTGVQCYYDNGKLAAWADVLFLCILPSHLPHVCAELRSHLPAHCLVYTFTSAVPLHRLTLLLGHSFVLKPQYEFVAGNSVQMWLQHNQVAKSLKDKEVVTATCPLSMTGSVSWDQWWVCALLYGLLNICTAEGLGSSQALQLLNEIFQTNLSTGTFICQSFVNSSCASTLTNSEEPFPWIHLVDAQTKQTPLSSYLSGHKALQKCISALYSKTFSGLSDRKCEMKE
ncbi:NADP-dependent oxidoreductase domain-containing protein 1 isoform X2 [Electrophorus electricus]|uniref:NADP-dependent oxidoreductase domain-containing protein 1 isoform X2 n=1 Tax=Electrophorus electricus TaxID=8005 RepID=UPI0015CFFA9D|nr:NADP-dependent oxidoreductase domain-containing protein 1 isoform X2 [Electrophorus electricus]